MRKRMKEILRDRRASSFPMTIGIVLSLIILMCGISEYFRLQIIAAGVREAVEDAVISTVNDNYAGVYHGVREGYSGSYVPFGEGSWEEDLNEGDIYDYLDETIGTRLSGVCGYWNCNGVCHRQPASDASECTSGPIRSSPCAAV